MRLPFWLSRTIPFTAVLLAAALLDAEESPWRDATRDVYINGELDRAAQVLAKEGVIAVLSPRMAEALLLDRRAETFAVLPKDEFRFSEDRATAKLSKESLPHPGGSLRNVDSFSSILSWNGGTVLVARHQGLLGEVKEEALWSAVPVWKALYEAYRPESDAVAAIRKVRRETTVTIVFGTWCGDSKEFVPRLLKTVSLAGNRKLSVRLVALDNQFLQPSEVIQRRRVINVPTIIVEAGGRELGRIIETPACETIEEDFAAILRGKPTEHRGRYERGPELARGSYVYRDESGERGLERWSLFQTKEGGLLVHSRIEIGDLSTEVFQGMKASGELDFAEITKRQGEGVMRARFRLDGGVLKGHLRGKEAGILQQDIAVPSGFAFASPAVAASLWMEAASRSALYRDVLCYVAPESFETPLGSACIVTYRVAGEEAVRVPAGEFRARRLALRTPRETSDWWLHPRLGIPVKGEVFGGRSYELASLEILEPPPAKEKPEG